MDKRFLETREKAVLPYALYRGSQVREFDRIAIEELGIPGGVLMERAGEGAFRALRETWPDAREITVLAGLGNNGGDGYVIARLAQEAGLSPRVLQLGDPERISGDARDHAMRYRATGAAWELFERLPRHTDVIVDALLGTGLDRPVNGRWAELIRAVNSHQASVLSVDIPSGLDADTGEILGEAVAADVTVTFIALKRGLFTAEGPAVCGNIVFERLGVPHSVYRREVLAARRLDWRRQETLLPPRRRSAHKGDFGHVLVIGGNRGFAGAARLAAEAAARSGAGLVSLATRPENVPAVVGSRPEIMALGVESAADLDELLERATVVALGPGLGRDEWAESLWRAGLENGLPAVVDADALNLLAGEPRRGNWILTPHPGEAARLLGTSVPAVQADRFAAAEALQARFGGVVVLKGAGTLVRSGGTRPPAVCSQGNPGMASGGMGDVLTGLIAGLAAQGFDDEQAAETGVTLHAAAADRAAGSGERGLLATDLLPEIRPLVNPASVR